MENFDLVVASHLRWNFVWQRPQQLLSRLAHRHRILFIEEPIPTSDAKSAPVAQLTEALPNLTVLTPQVRQEECGETPLWLWPCRE
jgi:UDP-galactopyranose mutase